MNDIKTQWTENDINIIKENHGKKTLRQIMSMIERKDITYSGFRSKCQQLGLFRDRTKEKIPHRNTFNLEYWKIPNLSNSAMAGRTASDGCIFLSKHNTHVFSYKCSVKDECIIDEIIKELNFSGPKQYCYDKSPNSYSISQLVSVVMNSFDINSKYLKEHFNIVPQKTFRLGPTNLNDDVLNLAFCIGLMDGDGTIAIKHDKGINRKDMYIHFCSCSRPIVEWFKNLFDRLFPSLYKNRVAEVGNETGTNLYRLTICGVRSAIIVDYLRKFPIFKLERKWSNPEVLSKIEEYKQKFPQYFNKPLPDFTKYINISQLSNSQSQKLLVNT